MKKNRPWVFFAVESIILWIGVYGVSVMAEDPVNRFNRSNYITLFPILAGAWLVSGLYHGSHLDQSIRKFAFKLVFTTSFPFPIYLVSVLFSSSAGYFIYLRWRSYQDLLSIVVFISLVLATWVYLRYFCAYLWRQGPFARPFIS